jgi:hypothetical protein
MRPLRFPALAATGLVAALLSGCSGGESMALPALFGGGTKAEDGNVPEEFRLKPTCPVVEIRAEAESMSVYDTGKTGDPASLRYQSMIQRVARDCDLVGPDVVVRVGIAGRVAAGPKGAAGTIQVPVRVVVLDASGKPTYSKAHIVPATLDAPDFSALWSVVDDQVTIPAKGSADTRIIVGIDELALKAAPARPARPAKPRS